MFSLQHFIVFDVETTGLYKQKGDRNGSEVVQFAGIIFDANFNVLRVINRYSSTTQLIPKEVTDIHHLDDALLHKLSDGKFFEQIVTEEGLNKLDNITWIGYNSNSCDIPIINQTLKQNGLPGLNFGKSVQTLDAHLEGVHRYDCMMSLGNLVCGRRSKLSELIKRTYGIEEFIQYCQFFRTTHNIVEPIEGRDSFFHNAIYDALALYLLIARYKANLFG